MLSQEKKTKLYLLNVVEGEKKKKRREEEIAHDTAGVGLY